jgi:hypothetical protein
MITELKKRLGSSKGCRVIKGWGREMTITSGRLRYVRQGQRGI